MDVDFAAGLIESVRLRMTGRMAHLFHNVNIVAWCVSQTDGDHLEIGTLHGGSAIVAALVKRANHLSGNVFCIDPLDGFYTGTEWQSENDFLTNVPVTPEILNENTRRFDVSDMVQVIQAKSYPFPDELSGKSFSTCYIDGDHWHDAPRQDWESVKDRATRFVVFDNCDPEHPAVVEALELAKQDSNWKLYFQNEAVAVMERRTSWI